MVVKVDVGTGEFEGLGIGVNVFAGSGVVVAVKTGVLVSGGSGVSVLVGIRVALAVGRAELVMLRTSICSPAFEINRKVNWDESPSTSIAPGLAL